MSEVQKFVAELWAAKDSRFHLHEEKPRLLQHSREPRFSVLSQLAVLPDNFAAGLALKSGESCRARIVSDDPSLEEPPTPEWVTESLGREAKGWPKCGYFEWSAGRGAIIFKPTAKKFVLAVAFSEMGYAELVTIHTRRQFLDLCRGLLVHERAETKA